MPATFVNASQLLILSQVILSLQLSFAVIPLVQFTSEQLKMGQFANTGILKWGSWVIAIVIATLNIFLPVQTLLPFVVPEA